VALYEYDVKGRIARIAPAHASGSAPAWLGFTYDAEGRVTSTQQENGSIERTNFDRATLPNQVIPTGAVRLETDAWQRQRYIVTDALGRTVQVLTPVSGPTQAWTSTSYAYDARSNLLNVYSDLNRSGGAVAGRRFAYDGLSRRTHQYLIERSPRLSDTGVVSTNGTWSDVFGYDTMSNLVRHVDPRGVQVRYDYGRDGLQRLRGIQVALPAASPAQPPVITTPSVNFRYSTAGDPERLVGATVAGIVDQAYEYDPMYRFTDVSTRFVTKSKSIINQGFRRDNDGRIERYELVVGGRTELDFKYGYGADGRRTSIEDTSQGPRGFRVEARFDALGVLAGYSYRADGWKANELLGYEHALQRIASHQVEVQGRKVFDEAYVFSAIGVSQSSGVIGENLPDTSTTGQLRGIRDQIEDTFSEFDYDGLGRLAGVSNGPVGPGRFVNLSGLTYSYDFAGNRTHSRAFETQLGPLRAGGGFIQRDVGAGAADGLADLQFDPLTNRISSPGFEYDAAGNLTRLPRKDGGVLLLAYDGLGRLSRAEREGEGYVERYHYGLGPTRVIVESTGQPRRFFAWSGLSKSAQFIDGGTGGRLVFENAVLKLIDREVVRLSGSGSGRNVGFVHTTSTKRFETSPQWGFRTSGTSPYGTNATTAVNGKAFHTYERSPLGIDDALNRAYDPETGRFLQPDPLGAGAFSPIDPQTLNLFTFVRNDPVNRRDPLGLDDCEAGGAATPADGGGILCTYAYPKTVYETVVRAANDPNFDGSSILSAWGVSTGPFAQSNDRVTEEQFQQAVDEGLLKKLRELREKKAKEQLCGQARAAFATSANAYARLNANILMQNYSVEALQYAAVETSADVGENIAEQLEDPSVMQGGFAVAGRVAGGMSIRAQMKALQVQKALLETDRKSSLADLRKTTEAMNAACK
jgi:RHS repeat-associated protein